MVAWIEAHAVFFLSFYYLVDRHGGDYIRSFSIDLDLFQSFAASLG